MTARPTCHQARLELDVASAELCTAIDAFARGNATLADVKRRRAWRDRVYSAWWSASLAEVGR